MAETAHMRYATILLTAAVFAGFVSSGAVVGYYASAPPGTIVPGVHIDGIPVGGLTPDQAGRYLQAHVEHRIARPIEVILGGESWSVSPLEVGAAIDLSGVIRQAHAIGRSGNPLHQVVDRYRTARGGVNIPLRVTVDPDRLAAWLDGIAARVERPPEDARVEVDSTGSVYVVPSKMGYLLDRERMAERLTRAVLSDRDRTLRLTLEPVPPRRTTEDARELGIRSLMGAFTTRFDPSDFNRTQNIIIAAQALDGVIIAPGEVFSFNRQVGPRIASAGYKEAPVIIDGELVPDIGGGVCQVSTTLYNAVLMAGLKVTQRIPHSIPAAYVPLGRDATVAYDYIDFKFSNDSSRHVMIKAWTTEDEVTIAFYGNGPEYRRVRLESDVVSEIAPRLIELPHPDLEPGERRVVKQGRRGYHVQVWRIGERADGRVDRTLVAQSVYRPSDRVVWVGAEQEPAFTGASGEGSVGEFPNAS